MSQTRIVNLLGAHIATLDGAFHLPEGEQVPVPGGSTLTVVSRELVLGELVDGVHATHVKLVVDSFEDLTAAGPWFVYSHAMGGDTLVVETSNSELADRLVCALTGVDTMAELHDFELGPAWARDEGPGPDGSHTRRPVSLDEEMGVRYDGSSRTAWYTEAEARDAIALRTRS